jgi:hypothetical protein
MGEPVAVNQTIVGRSIKESCSMFLVVFIYLSNRWQVTAREDYLIIEASATKMTTKLTESRNGFPWMIDGVNNEKPNFQRFFDKISKDNTQFVSPKSIVDQFVPPVNKLGFESKNFLQSTKPEVAGRGPVTRGAWVRIIHVTRIYTRLSSAILETSYGCSTLSHDQVLRLLFQSL